MSDRTDVVLIDDHPLFTRGLELLLASADAGIRVVGRTDDAAMAVSLVLRCEPDVAVVDLAMPPPGGHDAIRAIVRARPATAVLALSGLLEPQQAVDALHAGAVGFLPKSSDPDILVPPIRAVGGGCSVLPRDLLQQLLRNSSLPDTALLAELSDEDLRLWRGLAHGASTEELAEQFHVSTRTAKRLVAGLLRRIGAANRFHAAALAGRMGLIDEPAAAS